MKRSLFSLLLCLCLIFGLSVSCLASDEQYVFVDEGYLTNDEILTLNEQAGRIADRYGCGVYIAIFDDMTEYGYYDVQEFGEAVYSAFEMGQSTNGNGVLLVLSMAERDYCLTTHGEIAYTAFPVYGRELLEDGFLPEFGGNDWSGGFSSYTTLCEALLRSAADGNPVTGNSVLSGGTVVQKTVFDRLKESAPRAVIPGLAAAAFYCFVLSRKMKSVKAAKEARAYVTANGTVMRIATDRFTHTTVVRQHIERNSGGGGGSHGGGHSSHGKF